MTRHRGLVLAALGVALLQIGFLSWIIAARAGILRDGREIVLKAEPIDPRDLLRGDYVTIGYAISSLPGEIVRKEPGVEKQNEGTAIYVRVKPDAEGFYGPVAARFGKPVETPPQADEIDIRGLTRNGWTPADTSIGVDYGIERYYVPEGQGMALQDSLRAKALSVRVSVDRGSAQIKALYDGGTMLYEEPFYRSAGSLPRTIGGVRSPRAFFL